MDTKLKKSDFKSALFVLLSAVLFWAVFFVLTAATGKGSVFGALLALLMFLSGVKAAAKGARISDRNIGKKLYAEGAAVFYGVYLYTAWRLFQYAYMYSGNFEYQFGDRLIVFFYRRSDFYLICNFMPDSILFMAFASLLLSSAIFYYSLSWKNGNERRSLTAKFMDFMKKRGGLRRAVVTDFFLSFISGVFAVAIVIWLLGGETDPLCLILGMSLGIAVHVSVFIILSVRKRSALCDAERLTEGIGEFGQEYFKGIDILPSSPLYEAGQKLISIDEAMKESIRKGIASEKMKVELITNVSHDLRTPLSSIMGYGEMLAEMELPEKAAACVKKLNGKAAYLSELVEDVFELSKAASGDIVKSKSSFDFGKLIQQTVGELYDRAEEQGREIIVTVDGEDIILFNDGARIHRVLYNLLDNALKYSLDGTRIYVEIENSNDFASAEIINTASYKMEFSPERITERFERGDKSRTGKGSGLGLAIAKTYTEACGGSLDISVKGDQFAAKITFPKVKEN